MAQMKKPATPMARTTKRGTPVAMPAKPSKTARPTRPGGRPKNEIPNLQSKRSLKPMTEAQKQAKALAALEAKRAAVAKKTGKRPNYGTN
jgi:hypothetical protein